jgi:hypothetical protein
MKLFLTIYDVTYDEDSAPNPVSLMFPLKNLDEEFFML